jgi:hypothetical protein
MKKPSGPIHIQVERQSLVGIPVALSGEQFFVEIPVDLSDGDLFAVKVPAGLSEEQIEQLRRELSTIKWIDEYEGLWEYDVELVDTDNPTAFSEAKPLEVVRLGLPAESDAEQQSPIEK